MTGSPRINSTLMEEDGAGGGLLMPPSLRSPHKGGAGGLVACQLQRRRCECDGPAK